MGNGAIIAGQIAEMTIPTLLLFGIVFGIAKSNLRLKTGAAQVIGLWLLTLVVSGVINALFYELINSGRNGSMFFMAIPLAVSLVVIKFIAPRQAKDAVDEKNS